MLLKAGGGRQNENTDRPAVKKMGFSEWTHICIIMLKNFELFFKNTNRSVLS